MKRLKRLVKSRPPFLGQLLDPFRPSFLFCRASGRNILFLGVCVPMCISRLHLVDSHSNEQHEQHLVVIVVIIDSTPTFWSVVSILPCDHVVLMSLFVILFVVRTTRTIVCIGAMGDIPSQETRRDVSRHWSRIGRLSATARAPALGIRAKDYKVVALSWPHHCHALDPVFDAQMNANMTTSDLMLILMDNSLERGLICSCRRSNFQWVAKYCAVLLLYPT